MNINKFTQKSIQAVNDLEKIAYEYGNQEIEEEHLLYCLLNQEDSLILKLIEKMEINKDEFQPDRCAEQTAEGFRRTGLHRQGPEPCAGERRG